MPEELAGTSSLSQATVRRYAASARAALLRKSNGPGAGGSGEGTTTTRPPVLAACFMAAASCSCATREVTRETEFMAMATAPRGGRSRAAVSVVITYTSSAPSSWAWRTGRLADRLPSISQRPSICTGRQQARDGGTGGQRVTDVARVEDDRLARQGVGGRHGQGSGRLFDPLDLDPSPDQPAEVVSRDQVVAYPEEPGQHGEQVEAESLAAPEGR